MASGFFGKFNRGMKKTRDNLSGNIDNVLNAFEEIGDDLYDELTEVLVMSDVGVFTAERIIEELKDRVKAENVQNPAEVRRLIKQVVADMLGKDETIDFLTTPAVILVIGVNGVGKTTTIGKMAAYFKSEGKTVILGAADTFRAAAIDQLEVWAMRAGVDLVKHNEGADPAAVVFDTINAGINRNADVIIVDTAGRIHNKKNLMDELNKIYRVIDRELPYSDREIFLVLDATTGQNAISQAKEFMKVCDVSGIVLTKLDGTARGGVVLSIKNDLKLPVKFIGVGEGLMDLQPFHAEAFAEGLFDPIPEDEQARMEEILEENMHLSDLPEPAAPEEDPDRELTKKEEKALAKEQARAEKEAAAAAEAAAAEKARRKAEQKAKEQAKKEARARQLEEERARAEAQKQEREAAKARAEAEQREKEAAAARAREEAEQRRAEEARRKAAEEAERKAAEAAAAEAADDPIVRLEKAILAVAEQQGKVGQLQGQLANADLNDAMRTRLQLQLDAEEAKLAILKRSVTELETEVMG